MAQALLSQELLGLTWAPGYTPLDPPALALIDSMYKFAGMHLLVQRDTDEVFGHCRFEADRVETEAVWVSYGVADQRRRLGYATEGAGAQVRWLLDQPHLQVLKAEVERGNLASKAVLRKLGFTPTTPGFQEVWQLSRPRNR